MDFEKLFYQLIEGKTITLRFISLDELASFKNSFRVYIHRQVRRLESLGMDIESANKSLCINCKDTVAQISFIKKERKQYSFQILEVRDNNNPPTEESSEERKS